MSKKEKLLVYSLLIFATSSWGAAFVLGKVIVQELSPVAAASIRFTIAFFTLLPILIVKEKKNALVPFRQLPLLIASGLTGVFLYNILFFEGLKFTSSINGSLIVAATPVITAIVSTFLFNEKIGGRHIVGLLLSIIGVIIILTRGSWEVFSEFNFNRGDLIISAAVICWATFTILGKYTFQRWSSLLANTYACGIGGLLLIILALPETDNVHFSELNGTVLWGLVFLGICSSAIAFVFWYYGIGKIGAYRASTFQYFVPLSAALLSVIFLGEKLQFFHIGGALLIFGGVYLASHKVKRRKVEKTRTGSTKV